MTEYTEANGNTTYANVTAHGETVCVHTLSNDHTGGFAGSNQLFIDPDAAIELAQQLLTAALEVKQLD